MARKNAQTLKSRIAGATSSYLGNTRVRNTAKKGNEFGSRSKNTYNMKRALGMAAG